MQIEKLKGILAASGGHPVNISEEDEDDEDEGYGGRRRSAGAASSASAMRRGAAGTAAAAGALGGGAAAAAAAGGAQTDRLRAQIAQLQQENQELKDKMVSRVIPWEPVAECLSCVVLCVA